MSLASVPTGDLSQTQRWLRELAQVVRLVGQKLKGKVNIGYGGIVLKTTQVIGTIGDVNWIPIISYDEEAIDKPRFVIQDPDAGTLSLQSGGVWLGHLAVSMEFDESNGSREMRLQVRDVVTGLVSGTRMDEFVGRNTAGGNFSFTVMAQIEDVNIDNQLIVELKGRNGSTFNNVTVTGARFHLHRISEYPQV